MATIDYAALRETKDPAARERWDAILQAQFETNDDEGEEDA
jgi:hypothetical protein